MLEKLGIRIVTSLICMWYIIQMTALQFQIDIFTFLMMILYSILISLIIECGYSVLRNCVHMTPFILICFVIIVIGIKYWLGWGIYLGLTAYAFISIGFDLFREYKMMRLLKKAVHNYE